MTQSPANYIILMLASGMIMGAVFDIYNTVTSAANWLRFLRAILDIVFFVVAAFFVFQVSLITDNGRFRLYTFGLLLIGYVIYRVIFHRMVVASAHAIIRFIRAIILGVWKIILLLIVNPIRIILRITRVLLINLYRILCKIEDIISWCVVKVSKIALFPFKGYTKIFPNYMLKLRKYEEGIWMRLSNWLKRRPDGA